MYASCPRRGIVPLEVPPPTPHQALVVGSYQGCSETLHVLGREVAEAKARTEWRQMGARSEHEALGIFVRDVHRRWGSVLWRSWARVIRDRLPVIGLPNADFLHHGPSPAYSRGRGAVGGAEPWPQVHTPGVGRSYAGGGARGGGIGGGPVSGARRPRAGRYRLSRPCPG